MVISYPSGAVGSWKSFFTITPYVIADVRHSHGSVIPNILPQCVIFSAWAALLVQMREQLQMKANKID